VREHVSTNTLTGTPPDLRYRLWGLDLSGAPGGGGGGGGLLAEYRGIAPRPAAVPTGGAGARAVIPPADPGPETPSASVWFPCYDANGNVTEYVDTDGAVAAHYEYDPFGNTTAMSGPAADQFPFRFSTKCFDAETGLYYYGYRFYSPELGRWLSRDPIGEIDAAGLYLFCANNSIDDIDSYGLWKLKLAVDRIFKVASRGYVSFSGRADLGNGNGILELSAMGGIRFYFTEVITPGPIMGTVFGVFLEKQHIAQEVRIGAGGGGALECKCPDDSKAITCTLTKLFVSLSVQGLLGYQGNNARILGQASGGGQWDVLSGKVSLTGNIGVRAQWRKNQTWSGWEASKSGNIPLPFTLGSIGHKHFNIPLSKTCKCMSEDMDGSRLLEGLFHGLGN
jgi:RHS repeat-associated protein